MERQEKSKISLVKEILLLPEGERFLAATLLTILALVSCIVFMEIRYERGMDRLQDCEQSKQRDIKVVSDAFLNFVIKSNDKAERTKDKLDSINIELLKLKR